MEKAKKISVSDLSIGDWVLCEGEYWKISAINEDSVGLRVDSDYSVASLEECDPIFLTPEILEKNGLEYEDDENDAVIFLCCDMFWARLCVGDTFWQVGIHNDDRLDAVVCTVKHTHQLQHALRLAGVEKEIVL